MKLRFTFPLFCCLLILVSLVACSKLLEEKPNKAISIVKDLDDLKALLNAEILINKLGENLAVLGTDEYYLRPSDHANLPVDFRDSYVWNGSGVANHLSWSGYYNVV